MSPSSTTVSKSSETKYENLVKQLTLFRMIFGYNEEKLEEYINGVVKSNEKSYYLKTSDRTPLQTLDGNAQKQYKQIIDQFGLKLDANTLHLYQEACDTLKDTFSLEIDQKKIDLYTAYLEDKRTNGTEEEKTLYADMALEDFILRLISQRPFCFMNPGDTFKLRENIDLPLEYVAKKLSSMPEERKKENYIDLNLEHLNDKVIKMLYKTLKENGYLEYHNKIGGEFLLNKIKQNKKIRISLLSLDSILNTQNNPIAKSIIYDLLFPNGNIKLLADDVPPNGRSTERLYNADTYDAMRNLNTGALIGKGLAELSRDEATFYATTVPLDNYFPYELLPLEHYLSYEEIQLSSLLTLSSDTLAINDGARFNNGVPATNMEDILPFAHITAQVGARFEVPGVMEFQHMLITKQQNTYANGYGDNNTQLPQALKQHWVNFYDLKPRYFPTYDEVEESYQQDMKDESKTLLNNNLTSTKSLDEYRKGFKYVKVNLSNFANSTPDQPNQPIYLNVDAYKMRLKIIIEEFLNDAEKLGRTKNMGVYVHAVGLGMGAWAIDQALQTQIMLDTYATILQEKTYEHIMDIDFSYLKVGDQSMTFNFNGTNVTPKGFPEKEFIFENEKIGQNIISIHFSSNSPFKKTESKKNKLLVYQVAYDGNSFPGNEVFRRNLTGSADPATAVSTLFLQIFASTINSKIKPAVTDAATNFLKKTSRFAAKLKGMISNSSSGSGSNPVDDKKLFSIVEDSQNPSIKEISKEIKDLLKKNNDDFIDKLKKYLETLSYKCLSQKITLPYIDVPAKLNELSIKGYTGINIKANNKIEITLEGLKKMLQEEDKIDAIREIKKLFLHQGIESSMGAPYSTTSGFVKKNTPRPWQRRKK